MKRRSNGGPTNHPKEGTMFQVISHSGRQIGFARNLAEAKKLMEADMKTHLAMTYTVVNVPKGFEKGPKKVCTPNGGY